MFRPPSVSGHPPSTPPDALANFPPELNAHFARLVNSSRMQNINFLTQQYSQLERGVKEIVSGYLKNQPEGGVSNHTKCQEENEQLKLELEEKHQRIKDLEEKLKNATNKTTSEKFDSVSSKTIGTPQPPAAPTGQDIDFQLDNKALRKEVNEIAASNTKMKTMLNKQIDELQKKLRKEREKNDGFRRKVDNETIQRREFEKNFDVMKKQLEMVIFCVNKAYDRYKRETKKWGEWSEHYEQVQSGVFNLVDAVRAGDLWDLELNSLEEMLKQSPPSGIDLQPLRNILENFGHIKKSRGKRRPESIVDGTATAIKNEPEEVENPATPTAATATATAPTVEDTRPPSPIIPEEEAEAANYDSDATTDDEDEAALDHFSPLARAMARGPGPETMQALFPPHPSSPIPGTARSRLHDPAGDALPPAPPTPIKLESDSTANSPDEHTRLGYYRFDREGGDTLDVDERGRPLDMSDAVVPSSPAPRRMPAEQDTNPQSILREEDVEQSNEMQDEAPEEPVGEQEDDDAPSDNDGKADPGPSDIGSLMSKLKYRQFGEPIVNSVRVDGTHIKEEPDTTPKASKILACPNTAPQPITKVTAAGERTPPSAKRKRTAKAQTTTKKRKVIRDADIDSVAGDGAYVTISQPKQSKKGGQLARLLEDTPEASQGLVPTAYKPTTKAAVVLKKPDPTTPRHNKKAAPRSSLSPGNDDEISPSKFRLNPDKNNGVAYAYHEGARKRAEKDCLPHCQKECCSGFANGKMLEMFPMPKPINQPPPFRSPSKQKSPKNNKQTKPITYSKKGNHTTTSVRKSEWELIAERREINSKYIKHRSAHKKAEEPLGFFDADFPSTQQLEAQREEADRRRREKGWEREREARKGGIWQRK